MEEAQLKAIIEAWMTENKNKAHELGMNIEDVQTEFIQVEVRGYKIQITMPPSFNEVGSDSAFFAINIEGEEGNDESFINALEALNEKLERIKIGPECLHTVLNNIPQSFLKYGCRKPAKEDSKPHVYRLVEDVNLECQAVTNIDGILPWCFVSLNQNLGAVELEINIKGIMGGDRVAPALGFSFDDPLIIHLHFTDDIWYMKEATLDCFRSVQVAVKQVPRRLRQMQDSIKKAIQELDEKTAEAIAKCFPSSKLCQYGPHVLVPQFVQEFFRHCESEPDGSLNMKGHPHIANSSNIFIALLNYVGFKLKNLRNQCVICEKQLPPLSGLWYCDAELCLYGFEEMAVGASVLQKLQNPELIELEIVLAAAAATSSCDRDIFEPFPSFLLMKKEIRDRSGFFSDYMPEENIKATEVTASDNPNAKPVKSGKGKRNDYLVNKNLSLLKKLIDSFPPISELKKCSNEIELVVKLGISWLQKEGSIYKSLSQKQYADKMWLPYKVLRYLLFTNRSPLHLLEGDYKLNIPETLYQFAIIYDSEREETFGQRRMHEGSVFAFHGSPIANWYSIIRNGLRCLSDTKYMSTGKAHGVGIYFATEINTSYNYAPTLSLTVQGKSKEYAVLALCEILGGEKHKNSSGYLVVPPQNEKDVVIRYLIVFDRRASHRTHNAGIKGDHMLSGNINLQEHYGQTRSQYIRWTEETYAIPNEQDLEAFRKKKLNTKST